MMGRQNNEQAKLSVLQISPRAKENLYVVAAVRCGKMSAILGSWQ
jgi:hypothetical protein